MWFRFVGLGKKFSQTFFYLGIMEKQNCLIVGLGNPGDQYVKSRHNIGFVVIDHLAKAWRGSLTQEKWEGLYASFSLNQAKVFLVKPQTFMNRSGRSVSQYLRFFKIASTRLLVIHDDLDMDVGRIKLVLGGGAGGHNGIKSITSSIGTKEFYRLKIGIGRPGKGGVHSEYPVEKYVLSSIAENEHEVLKRRYKPIVEGIESFLEDGPDKAMNLMNCLK